MIRRMLREQIESRFSKQEQQGGVSKYRGIITISAYDFHECAFPEIWYEPDSLYWNVVLIPTSASDWKIEPFHLEVSIDGKEIINENVSELVATISIEDSKNLQTIHAHSDMVFVEFLGEVEIRKEPSRLKGPYIVTENMYMIRGKM